MDYISTPGLDYGLYLPLDLTMDYVFTPGLDYGLYLRRNWTMDCIYPMDWTMTIYLSLDWTMDYISTPGLDYGLYIPLYILLIGSIEAYSSLAANQRRYQ